MTSASGVQGGFHKVLVSDKQVTFRGLVSAVGPGVMALGGAVDRRRPPHLIWLKVMSALLPLLAVLAAVASKAADAASRDPISPRYCAFASMASRTSGGSRQKW